MFLCNIHVGSYSLVQTVLYFWSSVFCPFSIIKMSSRNSSAKRLGITKKDKVLKMSSMIQCTQQGTGSLDGILTSLRASMPSGLSARKKSADCSKTVPIYRVSKLNSYTLK